MNAERLNAVARAIKQELDSSRTFECLTEITSALQNIVNQPANPQHQQTLAAKLDQIKAALTNAPSNNFSPAWRQIVAQIGGDGLVGRALDETISTIVQRNQITPTSALQELQQIHQSLNTFKNGINQLVGGMTILEVGTEELKAGEAEIGFEIPRKAIDNNLAGLEKELREMKFILGTFLELSTGRHGLLPIRTISSTNLQFFFTAVPSAAAALAFAIDKTVNAYLRVLTYKRNHDDLRANGAPDEVLKPLEEFINNKMETSLNELADEIESKHFVVKEGNRKNELRNGLEISLRMLANRIDRGFHFEARIAPIQQAEGDKGKKDALEEAAATIRAATANMRYVRQDGAPILSLPEAHANQSEKGGDESDEREKNAADQRKTKK